MKNLIRLEEIGLFILSVYLFSLLNYSWWLFPLVLLVPDIGMAGYFANTKIGAVIYNIFHHRAISIIIYIVGALMGNQLVQFAGLILFAHSTFDRVLGYGLKFGDNFKHTHLGGI